MCIVIALALGGCSDKSTSPKNENDPPVLQPIDARATNAGENLTFGIWSSDPDGTIPALTAENVPTNAAFVDSGTGGGCFTFDADTTDVGVHEVRFIASDGELADTELVAITVNPDDLLDRLLAIPNVEVLEINPPTGYARAFEIRMTQPLDPLQPWGRTFVQKMYLSHLDESAPMVLNTSGYGIYNNNICEAAGILQANQLYMEHRYMGEDRPDPPEWQYLTVANAAADCHQVVTAFASIYEGPWVNYGVSKGGIATLCYRRFYPEDVVATIAMVAPLMYEAEDPRFDVFLTETVGDAACRERLREFQRAILENREQVVPYVQAFIDDTGDSFPFGAEGTLELAVLEYPFAFWQVGPSDCSQIPEPGASAAAMYTHLSEINGLLLYSSSYQQYYAPVFYQAFTEFGYYGFITEHLEDLLVAVENPGNYLFGPPGVEMVFHPEVMADIIGWLQTQGNNIVYVYGGRDPWGAAAIELTGQTNAIKIVQPGANHSVKIIDLDDRELVYSALEEWVGVDVVRGFMPAARPAVRWLEF
jgi:hypothetical protein